MKLKDGQKVAKNFLDEYNLTSPIKIKKVTDILNIKLAYLELDSNKTSVGLLDGKFKNLIVLDPELPIKKKRFLICHKVGHILLEDQEQVPEKIINAFARELLMPSAQITKQVVKCDYNLDKLSEFFKVPKSEIITKLKTEDIYHHCHDENYGNFF
ncbi:hypothetical protein JCM16358_11070 [Halanaerocella petrolearia]